MSGASITPFIGQSDGWSVKKCQNRQKRGFGNPNDCTSVQQGFDIMLEYTNVYQQQKKQALLSLKAAMILGMYYMH